MRGVLWLLMAFWPGLLWADALAELKAFYRANPALEAQFEQRLLDEDGETLERYAGKLYLQRPGRFFWRYETPYPLELGSDGETLWYYDVDLGQMTLRDADASLGGTPAQLLGGELSRLDDYRIESWSPTENPDGLVWLALQPRSEESDFSQIRIGLMQGQPREMRLQDRLGQTTRLQLQDLRPPATPFSPERFEFAVPDGVTLVDERPAS